jgi:hypothetical protein
MSNTNNSSSGNFVIWTTTTGTTSGGWSVLYPIPVTTEAKKENKDGCNCKKCGEHYPYANKPNQKDGSFKCWACRHNY